MLQRHTHLKVSTQLFSQVNTLCNKPKNVAGYLTKSCPTNETTNIARGQIKHSSRQRYSWLSSMCCLRFLGKTNWPIHKITNCRLQGQCWDVTVLLQLHQDWGPAYVHSPNTCALFAGWTGTSCTKYGFLLTISQILLEWPRHNKECQINNPHWIL
jgi:hypothetical protein